MSNLPRLKALDFARLAYATYCKTMNDLDGKGRPLRPFESMRPREQDAWISVVVECERSRGRFVDDA